MLLLIAARPRYSATHVAGASGPDPVGGVDSTALYPPKALGAARSIEERRVADHHRHCDGRDQRGHW